MILVIEDNEQEQAIITRALEIATPSVRRRLACSVDEALDTIRDTVILGGVRLILLDACVDGGSGLDALEALDSRSELTGIPVVVLADQLSPEELTRAYELGARSVLYKPAQHEVFEEMLKAACLYWLRINLAVTDTRVRRAGLLHLRDSDQEA